MTKKRDDTDGAVFSGLDRDKKPADFMANESGMRPDQTKLPWGEVQISLEDGIDGKTLPPRSIWEKGHWKGTTGKDWSTWVVSGEGTPGNYETRSYILPTEVAGNALPKHPADWTKKLKYPPKGRGGGWSSPSPSWGGKKSAGAGLPYGLRIRCTGCGHFYKMDDMTDHAKACPKDQQPLVLWAMECECHKGNILMAATVLEGFPIKPPEAPDVSGDMGEALKDAAKGGEDGGGNVGDGPKQGSTASAGT